MKNIYYYNKYKIKMPQYGLWSVKKEEPKSRPLLERFSLKSKSKSRNIFLYIMGSIVLFYIIYYMIVITYFILIMRYLKKNFF